MRLGIENWVRRLRLGIRIGNWDWGFGNRDWGLKFRSENWGLGFVIMVRY